MIFVYQLQELIHYRCLRKSHVIFKENRNNMITSLEKDGNMPKKIFVP